MHENHGQCHHGCHPYITAIVIIIINIGYTKKNRSDMEDHQRIAIISLNQKVVLRSQSGLPIAVNDLYGDDNIFCNEYDDRFDDA